MYARTRTHVRINILIIEKNKIYIARARGNTVTPKTQTEYDTTPSLPRARRPFHR